MPHALLATTPFHDSNKTAFFIAAGVLVAWAVLVSALGIRSATFATSKLQGRATAAITAVLVIVTAAMAVATAKTPPHAPDYNTHAVTNGTAAPFTPVSAVAAPTSGPLQLSANPQGILAFNTTSLVASSSHVTIDFTNKSPLMHNVTVADAAGKVLGATPTFMGGTKVLTLDLPAGKYTYYCSVPGHEQAGMKGTLIVR